MSLTLPELKARLAAKHDPDTLLEILGITTEDLVEAFEEKILAKEEELLEQLQEDDEFTPEEYREHDDDSV